MDVAVFRLGQSHQGRPDRYVSRAEARELKKSGNYYFCDHGTALQECGAPRPEKDWEALAGVMSAWQTRPISKLSPEDALISGIEFLRITTLQCRA